MKKSDLTKLALLGITTAMATTAQANESLQESLDIECQTVARSCGQRGSCNPNQKPYNRQLAEKEDSDDQGMQGGCGGSDEAPQNGPKAHSK